MTDTTLLIGAAPYRIDAQGTDWLIDAIRKLANVHDAMGHACIELADTIERQRTEKNNEPIELGHFAIEGLQAYVIRDYHVQGHTELTALYCALRRYSGDPI